MGATLITLLMVAMSVYSVGAVIVSVIAYLEIKEIGGALYFGLCWPMVLLFLWKVMR